MAEQVGFSVEADPAFTPFWRRLPRFLVYPMQMGPLVRMAGFALAGGVAILLLGPFGLLINLILWLVFLKYAFVVLERTAVGRFDEPNNLEGNEQGEISQVLRMIALLIILGILTLPLFIFLGKIGEGLAWLLINIVPPAGIMIIATTHSLGQALNPKWIIFYARTIGSPYLALCFLLLSVTSSEAWAQHLMGAHVNSWVVLPLTSFLQFYFTLITYNMMGYVIYQYHDKLGLHAEVSFEKAEAKLSPNKQAADPFLAKLGALMAEGKEEEACGLLREELRINWDRNDLHERYQKLLVALGKKDLAADHARDFIGKLVLDKKLFQAMDLCEQGLKADPAFQPKNADHVYELAAAASLANRHKLALDLMRGFDKRYPGHKHIPQVYLLSAKILEERYGKAEEAAKILRALQAKFPEHALAAEARKYLAALARTNAAGQKSVGGA